MRSKTPNNSNFARQKTQSSQGDSSHRIECQATTICGTVNVNEFDASQHQNIARLKIETRLKQLNDYTQSKDSRWRDTYLSRYSDKFDFFQFLDREFEA